MEIPVCFGDMRTGNTYAERCCDDCVFNMFCDKSTRDDTDVENTIASLQRDMRSSG